MSDKPFLLIVDDDALIQDALDAFLSDDYEIVCAANFGEVKSVLMQLPRPPDFALVDLGLPPTPHEPTEGFAVIGTLQARAPDCVIVVVSGQDARRHGQRARALGAADYAEKPCAPQQLKDKLTAAAAASSAGRKNLGLIGESPPIQKLREQIRLIAPVAHPVLITGESGAGKELVARALHQAGRSGRPFLAVNCAAIPEHLVEPTLFGHNKGAFTGASIAAAGYLGDAGNGTLLLDEIGDLPDTVQPKLLRVLETGEYRRVGDSHTRQCTARIIAATNRRWQRAGGGGRIRDDLYYRLSVFNIALPPLRQLNDDRFLLLEHFRAAASADMSTPPFSLDKKAKQLWAAYDFPGNVRELKNIVARLQVHHPGQKISDQTLREEMCDTPATATTETTNAIAVRLGREAARAALDSASGDWRAAAAKLSIGEEELRLLLDDSNIG